MSWTIHYFNKKVQAEIESLPVGIYADYLRLMDLMIAHGANLRLPHSKAMRQGLFELRCQGREGIGRVFYCTMRENHVFMLHSFVKKTQKTPKKNWMSHLQD